jgi:hypothetical protein
VAQQRASPRCSAIYVGPRGGGLTCIHVPRRCRRRALGALPMVQYPWRIKWKIFGQSISAKQASLSKTIDVLPPRSPTVWRIASPPLHRPGSPPLEVHVEAEVGGPRSAGNGTMSPAWEEAIFLMGQTERPIVTHEAIEDADLSIHREPEQVGESPLQAELSCTRVLACVQGHRRQLNLQWQKCRQLNLQCQKCSI